LDAITRVLARVLAVVLVENALARTTVVVVVVVVVVAMLSRESNQSSLAATDRSVDGLDRLDRSVDRVDGLDRVESRRVIRWSPSFDRSSLVTIAPGVPTRRVETADGRFDSLSHDR
jgi:hypothetical protein|tara:strand:- start:209 stop:559 length:351 start_codon:yes stop_codon:yes gene_type:complete